MIELRSKFLLLLGANFKHSYELGLCTDETSVALEAALAGSMNEPDKPLHDWEDIMGDLDHNIHGCMMRLRDCEGCLG